MPDCAVSLDSRSLSTRRVIPLSTRARPLPRLPVMARMAGAVYVVMSFVRGEDGKNTVRRA